MLTKKTVSLTAYQQNILHSVANIIYNENVDNSEILLKREQNMKVNDGSSYHADYIMMRKNKSEINTIKCILEMQGGGETSNTGVLTKHIANWENSNSNNEVLRKKIDKVGTLETNAWRRQQEQFIVKGNIVIQTGGKMVFCVGDILYDYLLQKMRKEDLRNLRDYNWTLALLTFVEDKSKPKTKGPIPLKIDENKLLFTNYNTFVEKLVNQGNPDMKIFLGRFEQLDGTVDVIK